MKRTGLLVKLTMLLCAAITIVFALPTSLAYMTARSNTLHNAFRVVYQPAQDVCIPIQIQKTVVNLSGEEVGPGGFEFVLIDTDTGVTTAAATSSEDGRAAMNLTFTAEDADKNFHYRLYEVDTGRENVVYDDAVYEIEIALSLDENHEICAGLSLNGAEVEEIAAEFENQYYVAVIPPDTGDPNHPLLWLAMLMLSAAGLIAMGGKRAVLRRK